MVAHEVFDEPTPARALAPVSPPPESPPPRRFGGRLLAAVVAVGVLGGTGSGALAATLIEHATPSATATRAASSATTTTSASSVTSATAAVVYQQVSPGVVTITTVVSNGFGVGQGTGSGIVLDSRGDILTNYHVIAGAQQIEVKFSDGTTADATVVGTNTGYDLAVIRVSVAASKLHPVTLGNSDGVQIGDTVYAIGSPFGLSGSLSEGIVSNLHQRGSSSRSSTGSNLVDLIQTDTPINPGNSGGPLVNAQGEVIGINQSIESPVDGNVGIGFAIPSNQVKRLLSSLEGGSNL